MFTVAIAILAIATAIFESNGQLIRDDKNDSIDLPLRLLPRIAPEGLQAPDPVDQAQQAQIVQLNNQRDALLGYHNTLRNQAQVHRGRAALAATLQSPLGNNMAARQTRTRRILSEASETAMRYGMDKAEIARRLEFGAHPERDRILQAPGMTDQRMAAIQTAANKATKDARGQAHQVKYADSKARYQGKHMAFAMIQHAQSKIAMQNGDSNLVAAHKQFKNIGLRKARSVPARSPALSSVPPPPRPPRPAANIPREPQPLHGPQLPLRNSAGKRIGG